MMETLDEQPKGKQDYDQWISDGIIVGKSKLLVDQAMLFYHIISKECQSFYGMS